MIEVNDLPHILLNFTQNQRRESMTEKHYFQQNLEIFIKPTLINEERLTNVVKTESS